MATSRTVILARVDKNTHDAIKAIAVSLGYVYGGEGSIGKLLDAIAKGDVLVVGKNNFQ